MSDEISFNNLQDFQNIVRNAETDDRAELFVRNLMSGAMLSCPVHVLLGLAQSLIDARKKEMRDEAESN